jgi:hypothetical protein
MLNIHDIPTSQGAVHEELTEPIHPKGIKTQMLKYYSTGKFFFQPVVGIGFSRRRIQSR